MRDGWAERLSRSGNSPKAARRAEGLSDGQCSQSNPVGQVSNTGSKLTEFVVDFKSKELIENSLGCLPKFIFEFYFLISKFKNTMFINKWGFFFNLNVKSSCKLYESFPF